MAAGTNSEVVIDVPDAHTLEEDGVLGETPPAVAVHFESVSCFVPSLAVPGKAMSGSGLKKLLGMKATSGQSVLEMRQVRTASDLRRLT